MCRDLIEWLRLMEPDHHCMHHHRIMHRQSIQTRLVIIGIRETKLSSDEVASKNVVQSDQAPTLAKCMIGVSMHVSPKKTVQDLRHLQGGQALVDHSLLQVPSKVHSSGKKRPSRACKVHRAASLEGPFCRGSPLFSSLMSVIS